MVKPDQDSKRKLLQAGQLAWLILERLRSKITVGQQPTELEQAAREIFAKSSMKPAFLGYKGYPAATCVSVNSTIVHGIPSAYQFRSDDVVSVDLGVDNDGVLVDCARTYGVGQISPTNQRLIETAEKALQAAINLVRPGVVINQIGRVISQVVREDGFFVVEELTGHGIGAKLQEPPTIYNYYRDLPNDNLKVGQTIAIEPIISLQPTRIKISKDGWTITADPPTVTAHAEDTILVTSNGHLVVTRNKSA